MYKIQNYFCGFTAFLVLAAPVYAQQEIQLKPVKVQANTYEDLTLTQPATSGSRLDLTPLQTPASVEVIPGDIIRARGDYQVVNAITRAVGFSDAASPGNGSTGVTARGFSGHGSVMQLYDGSRLYVGAGTVTFPFDTWSVDRVEVLHGPASVLYGEGAVGGAVNIVPKKPSRETAIEGRLAYGSNDTRRAAFGVTGPLANNVAGRFDISHNASNGWVDHNGESESLMLAGALRWDLTSDLAMTLSYDDGHQQPTRYYGVPLRNGHLDSALEDENFNVEDSVLDYRDKWTRLNIAWHPNETFSLTNELYYFDSERHWRNAENYSFTAAGLVRRTDFLEILHNQQQIGNRLNAKISHDLLGFGNAFSIGFDINNIDFKHTNNSPYTEPATQSLVDPYAWAPGYFLTIIATTPRFKTETEQHSVFFEDRFEVNEQLSLVAGARYDSAKLERNDLITPAASFDENFYTSSWRVGAVYNFTPTFVVYGQYSTGSDHLGSLITTSASQANFDLSTGKQWEIGLKQALADGRGEWTLAYYDITKKKLLSRDPDNPAIDVQIGQRSAHGVEASIGFDLGYGLRVDANAAALQARYDDFKESVSGVLVSRDGNVPSGIPERTGNLWLKYSFLSDWKANAGMRYVGKRYSNTTNTLSVESYTVFDAGLRWQTTQNIGTALRIANVTDEVYTTSSNSTRWLLAPPRTLELIVDFRY